MAKKKTPTPPPIQIANYDAVAGIFYGCIQINHGLLNPDVVNDELWSGGPNVTCEWSPEQYEADEETGEPTNQLQDDCGEPVSWEFNDEKEGVQGVPALDNTCFIVIKSPFYTYARPCSPCVPNAGDLDNAGEDESTKCYCPPLNWFEEGKAPPIWQVADNIRVN
jgi:hypothetical protein